MAPMVLLSMLVLQNVPESPVLVLTALNLSAYPRRHLEPNTHTRSQKMTLSPAYVQHQSSHARSHHRNFNPIPPNHQIGQLLHAAAQPFQVADYPKL